MPCTFLTHFILLCAIMKFMDKQNKLCGVVHSFLARWGLQLQRGIIVTEETVGETFSYCVTQRDGLYCHRKQIRSRIAKVSLSISA